jgi:hypothetical protein
MSTIDSFTGEGGVSIITENAMTKVENYLKQSQAEFKLQGYLFKSLSPESIKKEVDLF